MKKYISAICILLTVAMTCAAADVLNYPYQKQIQKGEYAKVDKELQKKLTQSPADVPLLYAAAQLYSAQGNPSRDVMKAYLYACTCHDVYKTLPEKETAKLDKDGLTCGAIAEAIHSCCEMARDAARKQDKVEEYQRFLDIYTRCGASMRAEVTAWRNIAAFRNASATNTIDAYESFMKRYPEAEQVSEAQSRVHEMAYRDAVRTNRQTALTDYIKRYPYSPYLLEALNKAYPGKYKNGEVTAANWKNYKAEADKINASNPIPSLLIQRELMRLAVDGPNYAIALHGYYNFVDPMLDSCWLVMRDVLTSTGKMVDMRRINEFFIDRRYAELNRQDSIVIALGRKFFTDKSISVDEFIRSAAPNVQAYEQLVQQISADIDAGDIEKAIRYCEQFSRQFGADHRYLNLMDILKAEEEKLEKSPLSGSVNTSEGKEYLPIPSADGNTLYFVGLGRKDNIGGEDIYVSKKDASGAWQLATVVNALSTPKTNEGVHSMSTNRGTLIVFKDGRLQLTSRTPDGWSKMVPLPENINIASWQCDAMVSSDGKAMLFSARYPTPYERDTSINIFVSLLDSAGNWGTPFDIGRTINTSRTDRSPFLHPDMKTLYFSSAGHGGLGGLDVYKTTRQSDSWTDWSEPVNIGRQLNTPRNDWGYKFTTDGKTAYFSNGDDIYSVALPESMRPNAVATISGHTTDEKGQPVQVTIRWEDLDSHQDIGQSQTDAAEGSFFLVLPLGRLYGYYIDDDRFYPLSNNIDLRDITEMTDIQKEIQLVSYKQMVEEGVPVQVNNLFFPVNEWELLPQSENELVRVAAIINKHNFKVEISGHTDSSGDKKKNITLSQQRANSVRDFLIKVGCNPDMLTAKGYGSSMPVADNSTEEGKQQNRRVELRFVDK